MSLSVSRKAPDTVTVPVPPPTRSVTSASLPAGTGGWQSAQLRLVERLLPHIRQFVSVRQALAAADAAGGDKRGLVSAALLILDPHRPPLDLRIDYHVNPLTALKRLCDRAHGPPYHKWLGKVPVLADRSRHP